MYLFIYLFIYLLYIVTSTCQVNSPLRARAYQLTADLMPTFSRIDVISLGMACGQFVDSPVVVGYKSAATCIESFSSCWRRRLELPQQISSCPNPSRCQVGIKSYILAENSFPTEDRIIIPSLIMRPNQRGLNLVTQTYTHTYVHTYLRLCTLII